MKRLLSALVLSFVVLVAPALALAAVDINTASESQLESLPGIGPGKAKAIIAERQANGPFKSVDDLGRVKGIGDKTIAELRSQATVDRSPPVTGASAAGRDSPAPTDKVPWGWVAVVALAAGAISWFLLAGRSSAAHSSEPTSQQHSAASAPIVPKTAPAAASSEVLPKPAGAVSAGAPTAKPANAATSSPPPAPAGSKPASQPAPAPRPAGASPPPPAPAGPKRKDT